MSDIVADAKLWLADESHAGLMTTHSENCHKWHTECLVARLVAEVERHRMTEEERGGVAWAAREAEEWADENDDEHDQTHGKRALMLRALLDRTAQKEVGRE